MSDTPQFPELFYLDPDVEGPLPCPNCNDPACSDNQPMPSPFSVFVPGHPAPQGSKKHLGKGVMVESSKAVRPWRESVRWHVLDAWQHTQLDGAVAVDLMFVMHRPTSTPKRRTPPAVKKPDLDKLARAVLDAIGSTGVVWRDDAQVVALVAAKRLAAPSETPGVHLSIYPVEANI